MDVWSMFVSNLGSVRLFSRIVMVVMQFFVVSRSWDLPICRIVEIGAKPRASFFLSKPHLPCRKIGVSIFEIRIERS